MNSERWRRIEQIYYAALELEPAQRETFLEQSCAGDASFRTEVHRLLQNSAEAEKFIESPAMEVAAKAFFREGQDPALDLPKDKPADRMAARAKDPKHAPWWMYVLAAVFLTCMAARLYYCFIAMPASGGHSLQYIYDKNRVPIGATIKAVKPNSTAARAGLEPGDFIQSSQSGGLLTVLSQPKSGMLYWSPGQTLRVEVNRGKETKIIYFTPERVPLSDWVTQPEFRLDLVCILASLVDLVLALVIAFRRPYDPVARWGALFLALSSISIIYNIILMPGWYGTVLTLRRIFGYLIPLFPKFCDVIFTSVGITFATLFPRRQSDWGWIRILAWLPAVMLSPTLIRYDSLSPVLYALPQWFPAWYLLLMRVLPWAGFPLVAVLLIMNYRRLPNLNERRRVRVLIAGAALTAFAAAPIGAAIHFALPSFSNKLLAGPSFIWASILACLLFAFPIAATYAILRYRVFDFGVIIRQGVRYAAARGMLLSLVPLIVIVFAGDLLLHHDQPLGEILRRRAAIYVVLAVGVFLLHRYRKIWLETLDRRFFRERYDAQRILREVISEIREAKSYEKVAPRVTLQIEKALHPEFAGVLVRRPGEAKYRILAANESTPPPMNPNSKLMTLVRVLGKPVEISPSQAGWLWEQLPEDESEFLRRARLEWLFPISLAEGQTEALLAVGPKRSEEPYSREDQELLQGITSGLGLLLERSQDFVSDSKGFKECPECGVCYDSDSNSCKKEGAVLSPLPFSRLLTGRYRFEQRLGVGGMGMVYQALDTELERQVAVKLMHSELTSSADAVARFKQEARAAASFTHPNVVTVYDYGVSENQRAYIIMELLRGSTLRQALNKRGRFSAAQASGILSSVCRALEAAHRKRLVHRDLKPENIFLAESERVETVKILDFGVVKKIAGAESSTVSIDRTSPGMLVGTLKYMSPEELRGAKPSESWDLWALAVVAYELLAATHPFARSTALEARNAILDGRVAPLRTHLPEAPSSWQKFFDSALAFNPELRPQSALQLLSDFNQNVC